MDKIGKYQFTAETFLCDFRGRLFLGRLGNMMLNAADFHSSDRGFGVAYLNAEKKSWVLSRLAIEMNQMPLREEKFYIETWVESAMRFFTHRCFRITGADGSVYGYGRSIWAMISTETRQPQDILSERDGAIKEWIMPDYDCPIKPCGRVQMGHETELLRTIDTYYNDIDINGHVNSVKYIEHVLDLWPLSWYEHHDVRRLEVAYVAEGHQGDRLSFYSQNDTDKEWKVSIRKNDADELCRCSVVFSDSKD